MTGQNTGLQFLCRSTEQQKQGIFVRNAEQEHGNTDCRVMQNPCKMLYLMVFYHMFCDLSIGSSSVSAQIENKKRES
jgi:hypothetical protein